MAKNYNQQITGVKEILDRDGVLSLMKDLMQRFPTAKVYLVGGMIRDALLGRENIPDIDLVVSKVPGSDLEKFLSQHGCVDLVGKSFGVFKFSFEKDNGTGKNQIDIALPRTDHSFMTGGYRDFDIQSDPDLPIEQDLERRDFTINAMALDLSTWKLIDVFGGVRDLEAQILRTVNDPVTRFAEDYTRMLRCIRFSAQLGFTIEEKTLGVLQMNVSKLSEVAPERVRDEIDKIIMTGQAEESFRKMQQSGILKVIFPELEEGVGVTQNKNHIYTVFEHNIRSLGFAVKRNYSLVVRLASLFHDVGKPRTKRGEGRDCTFHSHDLVGGKMVSGIFGRLKYSKDMTKQVSHLVRHHMFYYSFGEVTDAGVRRLLVRLGKENIHDFIQLRICDRFGMGRPKGKPYKLLELERRLQIVQMDPISPKMLAINGHDIMKILNIPPSPRIGLLTKALLNEVLEDPQKNTKEYLEEKLREFHALDDETLRRMSPDIENYEEDRKKEVLKKYKETE